jgi:hypothetical protein
MMYKLAKEHGLTNFRVHIEVSDPDVKITLSSTYRGIKLFVSASEKTYERTCEAVMAKYRLESKKIDLKIDFEALLAKHDLLHWFLEEYPNPYSKDLFCNGWVIGADYIGYIEVGEGLNGWHFEHSNLNKEIKKALISEGYVLAVEEVDKEIDRGLAVFLK